MTRKRLLLIIVGLFLLISFPIGLLISKSVGNIPSDDPKYGGEMQSNYRIYSPVIPENLTFAGEQVPLDNYYVYEAVDRELLVNTYWQSNLILMIKRAYRFFPVIEPILAREKVPDDFKYLSLIESSFMNVSSPAGAAGFWQFLKATGEHFGLEINADVDERYDLEKSTVAACKYLKVMQKQFNSWTCAAAAYNMGEGGLKKQMDNQKQNNYWDLYLNTETSRYVSRILSLKIIMEAPTKYGLFLRYSDLYQPIQMRKIEVDSAISSLIDFSIAQKSNYRVLKEFNAWLRSSSLPNKTRKKYIIQLPEIGFSSRSRQLSGLSSKFAIYKADSISSK